MKIGDNNGSLTANSADLFDRLEQAHRESQLDIDAAGPAAGGVASHRVGPTESTSAANSTAPDAAQDPVQAKLIQIARRAIRGEFKAETKLRQEVVRTIVTERYARDLRPAQVAKITRTLNHTLVHDPSFRQEIERMLVLAARHLARAERG